VQDALHVGATVLMSTSDASRHQDLQESCS
jgi:hypothetical protein